MTASRIRTRRSHQRVCKHYCKRHFSTLAIATHKIIRTKEPNWTVASCVKEQEHSQIDSIDESGAFHMILSKRLTQHQIDVVREHWRIRHFQYAKALLFCPTSRTPRIKISMHITRQGNTLQVMHVDEDSSTWNALKVFKIALTPQ